MTSADIESRRTKSAQYRRAPHGYVGLSDMLKAFVRAWTPHFGPDCPMVTQTNVLRSALVQRKASYEERLTPLLTASIVWMFSQQVHAYLTTPYNSSGEAPTPNLYLLLANVRSETKPQPLSLPRSIVASYQPQPYSRPQPDAGDEATFGQDKAQQVNRTYRGVPSDVKKLLQPLTGYSGITLASVVQGRVVDPKDYVPPEAGLLCRHDRVRLLQIGKVHVQPLSHRGHRAQGRSTL
jgi:hypothetical protein